MALLLFGSGSNSLNSFTNLLLPRELAACQAAFILPCLLRQEGCTIIKAKYAPLTDSVEYREGKLKKQVVNW